MPRGKYVNHKGRNRHFTDIEELEQERKKQEAKKWRKKGEDDESEEESEEESADEKSAEEGGGSDEEEESSEDEHGKAKGVQGLIEIENPNRVKKKSAQKVTQIDEAVASGSVAKPELSRREREELEKQRAQANYQRLHAEGKTEQARADLARLAIIKQHRAEAAARREAEKKEKEEAKKKAGGR